MSLLLCGAAERITTPKLGLDIPGYFGPRPAKGVKSDLYTQAVVLDDGREVIVLISVDIVDFQASFARKIRNRLAASLGVKPEAVMTVATHIHTGQPTNYNVIGVKKNTAAMKRLEDLTVEAAEEAFANRRPVHMYCGSGEVRGISFVRNYFKKDGGACTNPSASMRENIGERLTEPDYGMEVIRFDDESGRTVAHVVNFACHPDVVGGKEFCADWPGEMRRVIKENFGSASVSLFLNGCAGNINHVDSYRTMEGYRYPSDHYVYMGETVAAEVLRVDREECREVTDVTLAATSKIFRAERRQPTEEMLESDRAVLADPESRIDLRIYAEEHLILARKPKRFYNVEVQAMRIGPCGLVGLNGEIYCEVGLAIKAASPFEHQMVTGLANGTVGYVVTEPAFSLGVYETKLARYNSSLYPQAADKMAQIADKLLKKLK